MLSLLTLTNLETICFLLSHLKTHILQCIHTYAWKTNFTFPKNQTIDGISSNKPERNALPNDVTDGTERSSERLSTESHEMFSSTELNQYEISSDEGSLEDPVDKRDGAARSRPVRAAAKKRKTKAVAKTKGRKQQIEQMEMDDVLID